MYKLCKLCENRARDTPLRGVYIPHFGQIWNFYSDLTKMWNKLINAQQGRISCAIFTKYAEFVHHFRKRLKFGWSCSRGYGVMGVSSWGGLVSPKFSLLPSGETVRQTPRSFRGTRTCSRSSITMPSLVGLEFHAPAHQHILGYLVPYNGQNVIKM